MTPRSSCPGGESTPLRGATSGSHYEINNVTETAVGISRGRHPERGYGPSYSPPGSFLESTGGSVLTRAEVEALHRENVLARRYFFPGCHRMEPYRTSYPHESARLPVTNRLCEQVLVLPTGSAMEAADVADVCAI